jgi:hypothetical protein
MKNRKAISINNNTVIREPITLITEITYCAFDMFHVLTQYKNKHIRYVDYIKILGHAVA